jgi:hypothetical protein
MFDRLVLKNIGSSTTAWGRILKKGAFFLP